MIREIAIFLLVLILLIIISAVISNSNRKSEIYDDTLDNNKLNDN